MCCKRISKYYSGFFTDGKYLLGIDMPLISEAVELELETMLATYRDLKMTDGRQVVVRNGYLPERAVQTGIGDILA